MVSEIRVCTAETQGGMVSLGVAEEQEKPQPHLLTGYVRHVTSLSSPVFSSKSGIIIGIITNYSAGN